MRKTPNKKQQGTQNNFQTLWRSLTDEPENTRFLVASVGLHLLVIFLLWFSWQGSQDIKVIKAPNSMQARLLTAAEIQQLQERKHVVQKKVSDTKKKKEQAKKKRREAEKKKKALKKKKQAEKKKRIADQRKAKETEKLRIKKLNDKRLKEQALEKQRQSEAKAEQDAREERRLSDVKKKNREQKMLDKLKALEIANLSREKLAFEQARQLELQQQKNAQNEFEISEVDRFKALIRAKITSRWHIPPKLKGKGLKLDLRINLLPNGELISAKVVQSSGKDSLDQSAELAANSIRVYPVPETSDIFERNFRQFRLRFSP